MKKELLIGARTDLALENTDLNFTIKHKAKDYTLFYCTDKNYEHFILKFSNILKVKVIQKELLYMLEHYTQKYNISRYSHIFVVGLGNEDNTADSVGPKTIKKINVNSYFKNEDITVTGPIISALEPGVLGNTGINSLKIIKSVTKEIKPDLVILVDSFVTSDVSHLNKSIQITDAGITPGSGLKALNEEINFESLKIPTITIGIPTALEISLSETKELYFLSPVNIDEYANKITDIIANVINSLLR